ncbi:MAG: AMP-binding protein [Clostridiales bacterium]|nr:AMP-binding protein [Clostridiales bacterium]
MSYFFTGDSPPNTVAGQLELAAARFPRREAFTFPEENLRLTYAEIQTQVNQVARALLALGVRKGDHIAIWSTNCSRWILLLFGAAQIGAPVVPVNYNYISGELEFVIQKADIKLLFSMREYRKQSTEELLRGLSGLDTVRVISMADQGGHCLGWSDFLALGSNTSGAALSAAARQVEETDVYSIQFTSGTTARPKGAVLQHRSVLYTASEFVRRIRLTEQDVTCIPLPLFHVFGNVLTTLGSVISGGRAVYQSVFAPVPLLELLSNERGTTIMGVPAMYQAIIASPRFSQYDLSSLKKGGVGGAYTCPAVARSISRSMGIEQFVIGYGMSETAGLCALSDVLDPEETRFHSVGKPLDGVEIKIRDMAGVGGAAPDGAGGIMVRGRCVMRGYYRDPAGTRAALDPEGWLYTGDVGKIDASGALHVTGRLKDIIVRGGENISPSEIEAILLELDSVADARCVGVPNCMYGEEVAAFIVPKEGRTFSAEEIRSHVQKRIAFYKSPRYVFPIPALPVNGAGKVMRDALRKMARELIQAKGPEAP